jgi:EAL domain-containing protein (putative c-di-GMP-specific phosphodiesterase class I)
MIHDLTWMMLEKTSRQRRDWTANGVEPEMAIAVNLSLKSLTDTDIADRIIQIVRAEGVEPTPSFLK